MASKLIGTSWTLVESYSVAVVPGVSRCLCLSRKGVCNTAKSWNSGKHRKGSRFSHLDCLGSNESFLTSLTTSVSNHLGVYTCVVKSPPHPRKLAFLPTSNMVEQSRAGNSSFTVNSRDTPPTCVCVFPQTCAHECVRM